MNRRTLVALFVGGAGAGLLAACGVAGQTPAPSSTPAPSAPTPAPTIVVGATPAAAAQPTTAATPRSGGTLRQGVALEVVSLDPMLKVGNDFVWIGVYRPPDRVRRQAQAAADARRKLGHQHRRANRSNSTCARACSSIPVGR